MNTAKTILLLDADEQSAQDIQRFLKVSAYTFNVSHASDIGECLNYLKSRKPDIILVDSSLAVGPEFASIRLILEKNKIPAILLSDVGGDEIRTRAEKIGAAEYLVKNKVNLFNLQKIIVNTLKISETATRLDNAFEENLVKQESFVQMMNKLGEGVMVISRDNAIKYANTKAYSILSDDAFRRRIASHISYRDLDDEEIVDLRGGKKHDISIRISDFIWEGERVNLFILDKVELKALAPQLSTIEILTDLLGHMSINLLLLKGDRIAFATRQAALALMLKPDEVRKRKLPNVFEAKEGLIEDTTIQGFMSEKKAKGIIKAADGSIREVDYHLRQLNLDDELYQLLTFEVPIIDTEKEIPKERNGDEKFTTDGVLHLASHDLREPVRTILNYVQLIADNLRAGKYDQAAEYADFAHKEGVRMERLLSDLKVYIGLGAHTFSMAKVSMKLAVTDVIKAMKPVIDAANGEVTVAELPEISADRELVEELLMHLIDNSIKFAKKDKKLMVDIGFDKYQGNIIFCVRDNGIGISKRYHEKIFELFERLNRVDEYPGNGLGLAICKKIVEMHGGNIWVESLPGAGSNFYFTLRSK